MNDGAAPDPGSLVEKQLRDGNIGVVVMNNPHQANCLSSELVSGILNAFDEFEKQAVRVVVLRAHPKAKVWSAGHDMKESHLTDRIP
ncbi:MAG: enoyl-CoA hydratase-related protein [Desulfomonilaceae bacterium]